MSEKENHRYQVIQDVIDKKVSQKKAADLLRLSCRQLRTLQKRVLKEGMLGIISRKVGKTSNRKYPEECRQLIVRRSKEDFKSWGPSLIAEKLRETDGLSVSSEYVRKVLIEHNLWNNRSRKINQHLPRSRRACFGEMIQADGSKHHWFGKDQPSCCLIAMIDDATGKITALFFAEEETTEAYLLALRLHIERYGIPKSLYTDRHSIFGGISKKREQSQFGRALKELGIESIFAHSPQAKGRVERLNRTLQDRLVKELGFQGITDINEANKFLPAYILAFNPKFEKPPIQRYDAHRKTDGYDLDWILAVREERQIDRQLTFQYHNEFYTLADVHMARRWTGKKVSIKEDHNGIEVRHNGAPIRVHKLNSASLHPAPSQLCNYKVRNYHRKNDHPYKKALYMKQLKEDALKTNWSIMKE